MKKIAQGRVSEDHFSPPGPGPGFQIFSSDYSPKCSTCLFSHERNHLKEEAHVCLPLLPSIQHHAWASAYRLYVGFTQ